MAVQELLVVMILYMLIPKKKTFQGLIAINLILFLTGIVFIIKING